MTKVLKKVLAVVFMSMVMVPKNAFACEDEDNGNGDGGYGNGGYGYGEVIIKNKSFDIEKEVRVEDEDEDWKDSVDNVAEDDVVEFRIRVKNTGEVTVDDMKVHDYLPDEMYRTGGDGLTEYWDDFEPGERKTFYIKAKVHSDEYDRDNFEKCVVNKAIVEYDGHEEGSDTAIVCYGSEDEIEELPATGATSTVAMAVSGFGLIALGSFMKRKKR